MELLITLFLLLMTVFLIEGAIVISQWQQDRVSAKNYMEYCLKYYYGTHSDAICSRLSNIGKQLERFNNLLEKVDTPSYGEALKKISERIRKCDVDISIDSI